MQMVFGKHVKRNNKMPSIEIDLKVFEPGQGYAKTNYRRSFIIHNKQFNEKIKNQDFKDICENIKAILEDYNKGERGNSWNWTPLRGRS